MTCNQHLNNILAPYNPKWEQKPSGNETSVAIQNGLTLRLFIGHGMNSCIASKDGTQVDRYCVTTEGRFLDSAQKDYFAAGVEALIQMPPEQVQEMQPLCIIR